MPRTRHDVAKLLRRVYNIVTPSEELQKDVSSGEGVNNWWQKRRPQALTSSKSIIRGIEDLTIPLLKHVPPSPEIFSDRSPYARAGVRTYKNAVAVKDNFVTTTLDTTCASAILQGFKGNEPSTVARILQEEGMIISHKTNMDEFGMGSHSTHSIYGAVQNGQCDFAQSAGGSSGGSAMTVAQGVVKYAIGSDTGGSVRLPAAYTGTFGFKPSYGRISRNGLVPYANSLDTVGIIAMTADNIKQIFKMLDVHDPKDPTSLNLSSRERIHDVRNRRHHEFWDNYRRVKDTVVRPIHHDFTEREWIVEPNPQRYEPSSMPLTSRTRRIGYPVEYNIAELHPLVHATWIRTLSYLESLGHEVVPVSLPNTSLALAAYYVLAPAEASSNLAKYDGVRYGISLDQEYDQTSESVLYAQYRDQGFGDETIRRILLGTYMLSSTAMDNYFVQAQRVRRLVQQDFNKVFRMSHPLLSSASSNKAGVDYLLTPTAPTPPPLLKDVENMTSLDAYMNDVFTVPASLAGLPAISIPAIPPLLPNNHTSPQYNIGMQLIGQYGDDMAVLGFARRWFDYKFDFEAEGGRKTKRMIVYDDFAPALKRRLRTEELMARKMMAGEQ